MDGYNSLESEKRSSGEEPCQFEFKAEELVSNEQNRESNLTKQDSEITLNKGSSELIEVSDLQKNKQLDKEH